MSKLLINEQPLIVLPSLVGKLNGNYTAAIILQQIHFLCQQPRSGVMHDGHKWVWFTYSEFADDYMPWLTERTIRSTVKQLENSGLLLSTNRIVDQWDNTKFYRVDVDALSEIVSPALEGQINMTPECQSDAPPKCHPDVTLECQIINKETKTSTKTSTKTDTGGGGGPSDDTREVFTFYESNFGLLTPHIAGLIGAAIDDYPHAWIMEAMEIAVTNAVRKWNYVDAILGRWKANGKQDQKPNRQHGPIDHRAIQPGKMTFAN